MKKQNRGFKRYLKKTNKDNSGEIDPKYALETAVLLNKWKPLIPISLDFYHHYSTEAWALACGNQGVYQIITKELVTFIKHLTKDTNCIEVCSGLGTLGRALEIPRIDRMVNQIPEVAAYYATMENELNKQIEYPVDIENMTAHQAVLKYNPQWIVASWVTQKLMPGSKVGQMYGPLEEHFIDSRNYIHLGSGQNEVHIKKRINKFPHYIIEADWIVAKDSYKAPSQMRIWCEEEIDFDNFPEELDFYYTAK